MDGDVRTRLDLRLGPAERAAWEARAAEAGLSLSAWVRRVCNQEPVVGVLVDPGPGSAVEPWWDGEKLVSSFKGPDPRPGKPKRS